MAKHIPCKIRLLLCLFSLISIIEGRTIPKRITTASLPSVFEALTQEKFHDQLRFKASNLNRNSLFSLTKVKAPKRIMSDTLNNGILEKSFHQLKHFTSKKHQFTERRRRVLTEGESNSPSTGLILPGLDVGPSLSDINSTLYRWDSITPPAEIDWRNVSSATVVHDQLECSSCWAMATSDSISIMWNLHNALKGITSNSTSGALTSRDMSPQQVCDCSLGTCCSGGWPEWGLSYAMFEGGLTEWLEYPYVASDGQCNSTLSKNVKAKITGWEQVPPRDINAMKKAVSQMPVIAFLSASSEDFVNYNGGVYQGLCSNELNHVVLIVGYGNDTIFGPYWIIKNSWGPGWGENGYMRIAMSSGPGTCGITSIPALYPVYHPYFDNPCDVFPPPCGAGTCYFEANGNNQKLARCMCPPGYVENLMGVAKCVAATPCSRNPNPCNFGICSDLSDGSYTCTCPENTVIGSRTDGGQTCVSGHGLGGVSTYIAVSGDTCESVSESYNITTQMFLEFNSFLNCNVSIPEGFVLAVGNDHIETGCSETHIIIVGDTCDSIKTKYGLTSETLLAANPLLNCSGLLEHQLVCVSNASVAVSSNNRVIACERTYNVRFGDTCSSIVKMFGMQFSKFTGLNPGLSCRKPLPPSLTLCVSNDTTTYINQINCTEWYRVQQGDTCPSIWTGASITQQIFLLYNPGIRCQAPYLQIGQQVCIGGPIIQPNSGSLFPYLVKTGDTLTNVAQTFQSRCPGLTNKTISQVNFQSNASVSLISGSTLLLPCTSKGVGRDCGCAPTTTVCGSRGTAYSSVCDASCNYDTPASQGACAGTCQAYCKGRTTLAPASGAPSYCTNPCPFPVWPPPSDWSWFSPTQCTFFLNQCSASCSDVADTLYPGGGSSWTTKFNSCYSSCKSGKPC